MKLHVLSNARDHAKDRSLHSTHALIFGGKIIAFPVVDWQATGGEKLFTNYNEFSCPSLFFSSLKYNEHAVKGEKKPGLVHRGGKRFFVVMFGEGDNRPPGQMRDICWCK